MLLANGAQIVDWFTLHNTNSSGGSIHIQANRSYDKREGTFTMQAIIVLVCEDSVMSHNIPTLSTAFLAEYFTKKSHPFNQETYGILL